jgi:phosphoribosyl-ATP pyrophosphohydrolase
MSVDPRIARLEAVIASRKAGGDASSYVASLFAKGREKIAQKVGEEATETVIAAVSGDKAALTGEAADLFFHMLVLLQDADLNFDTVLAELERREGVSGIAEKAARKS